jgi:hypothetical protein
MPSPKDFMSSLDFLAPVRNAASTAIDNAKYYASTAYNTITGQSTAGAGRGNARAEQYKNPYAHDDSNNAPKQTFDDVKIDFQSNMFDQYDTYTYHWKLFITNLQNAYDGTVLDAGSQTIIAESGVTELTIDNVRLDGVCVPSATIGTGTQTLFKFDIVEPGGAGLFDKMFYEASALGIGNWFKMPCFLQLEFRGRTPDTAEAVPAGSAGDLGQLLWVWPIALQDAKVNVTNVGSRYHFNAILYDELAQSNAYFSIQHNIVLNKLDTFGKAMSDLEDKLNADQYEKLIDNYSIPDTYRIVVDPILAKIPIALPDHNKHTSRNSDNIDFEKKVATYNNGTSVDKIVDSLLGSTRDRQEELQSAPASDATPDAANAMKPMRKFWRIITESRPIKFDMLRQDNAVEITIYIVEYDIGLLDVDMSQTGQTPDTLPAAKKRVADYAEKKILRKKYNYMFTGLNDQIIKFDLDMNFAFAAALSRFGGIFYDTASTDKGVSNHKVQADEAEAASGVRKTLQYVNNPPANGDIDAEMQKAQIALGIAKISPESRARYAEILSHAKPAERRVFTKSVIAAGGLQTTGNLLSNIDTAKSLASPTSNGLKFVSDVNASSPAAKQARQIVEASMRGKLRPIAFRESNQETNLANSIDPANDAGRARTSSVFSTALYSGLDGSLQKIKITIKGDPYWLFPKKLNRTDGSLHFKAKMSDGEAIDLIKRAQKDPDSDSVNLFGTDNFIVIRFRTPKIYTDATGYTEEFNADPYNEIETFSGIYRVITIESKFEGGRFTQELMCQLDPLINLKDFRGLLNDIETAVKQPDSISAPDVDIPTNSIKTQKILGSAELGNGLVASTQNSIAGKAQSFANNAADKLKSNIPVLPNLTASELLSRIPKIG